MFNDITIGPITFHMYGLMIAIGLLAGYTISEYRAKKAGLDENIIWGILVCAILGILIGSRLVYYLVSIPQIKNDPSILWNFSNGYVVYGGILFGILFSYLYCMQKGTSFLPYFDLVIPAVSIGQGFGRIGCLFAGCCYGKHTDSAFHIIYSQSEFAPNGVTLIPTQLISSIGNFAIAAILFAYARKKPRTGSVGAMYMILYSVGRFFIEYLRDDLRGGIGTLSTSQLISIAVFIFGITFLYILHHSPQKTMNIQERQ